jgi:hypothetical protein
MKMSSIINSFTCFQELTLEQQLAHYGALVSEIVQSTKLLVARVVKTSKFCVCVIKDEWYLATMDETPNTSPVPAGIIAPIEDMAAPASQLDKQDATSTCELMHQATRYGTTKPRTPPRYLKATASSISRNQATARQRQDLDAANKRQSKYPRWLI